MGLAHGSLQALGPLLVLLAKGAVLIGRALVLLLVLLPQQLQGDASSLEFAMQVGVVGLKVARLSCHGGPVQPRL